MVKTKGAQTWALLLFVLDELLPHARVPEQVRLLTAGEALQSLADRWRKSDWRLTGFEIAMSHHDVNTFLQSTSDIPGCSEHWFQPKRHICSHLIIESVSQGSQRFYGNWEGANHKSATDRCRGVVRIF